MLLPPYLYTKFNIVLVIPEIKMLRYDYKTKNEHMMKNLVVALIGKEMRYFAKFTQGCMLQSNNFSWY